MSGAIPILPIRAFLVCTARKRLDPYLQQICYVDSSPKFAMQRIATVFCIPNVLAGIFRGVVNVKLNYSVALGLLRITCYGVFRKVLCHPYRKMTHGLPTRGSITVRTGLSRSIILNKTIANERLIFWCSADSCVLQIAVFCRQLCSADSCVMQIAVFCRQLCSADSYVLQIAVFCRQLCSADSCVLQIAVFCRQLCSADSCVLSEQTLVPF